MHELLFIGRLASEVVLDATKGYFYESKPPAWVRLYLVREEIIDVA